MTSYSLLLLLTPSYSIRTKMKFIPYIFFVLLLAGCMGRSSSNKAQLPQRPTAKIVFADGMRYDFGTFYDKDTLRHSFVFENVGTVPFVVDSVIASCGCTTCDYPKYPVQPGAKDSFVVKYDGNGFVPGYFTKRCDIYSNTDSMFKLRIRGYYYEEE